MKLLLFFIPFLFGAVLSNPLCGDVAKKTCPKVIPDQYSEELLKECWYLEILLKCLKRVDDYCFFHFYRYYELECGRDFLKNYVMGDEIAYLKEKLSGKDEPMITVGAVGVSSSESPTIIPCDNDGNK